MTCGYLIVVQNGVVEVGPLVMTVNLRVREEGRGRTMAIRLLSNKIKSHFVYIRQAVVIEWREKKANPPANLDNQRQKCNI